MRRSSLAGQCCRPTVSPAPNRRSSPNPSFPRRQESISISVSAAAPSREDEAGRTVIPAEPALDLIGGQESISVSAAAPRQGQEEMDLRPPAQVEGVLGEDDAKAIGSFSGSLSPVQGSSRPSSLQAICSSFIHLQRSNY